jgi:HEAT repeat protein
VSTIDGVVAAGASLDWARLAQIVASAGDPRVRAFALATLVHDAPRPMAAAAWRGAATDSDAHVRLRAAQLAPRLRGAVPCTALLTLFADDDAWVVEAAAFALGEHPRISKRALDALARAATTHADPLAREAAVAALGAQGEPSTLPAVLAACDDKPAIRRRAVLALAAFDGNEVDARLQAALADHDWQVRQAAEDLLNE